MTDSLHQQAKELFAAVCELPIEERERQLAQHALTSPDLVQEVRSLLDFHTTGSSVIAAPPPLKVRTKSTLSTTFQSRTRFWLKCGLRSLAVTIPVIVAGILLGFWTDSKLQSDLRNSVSSRLSEQLDQRFHELIEWERIQIANAEGWCLQPTVIGSIRELFDDFQSSAGSHNSQAAGVTSENSKVALLGQQLQSAAGERVDFALWDQRMLTVADSGIGLKPERLDSMVNPMVAQILAPVLRGYSKLCYPQVGSFGWSTRGPNKSTSLFVVLCIRKENDEIAGAMMLRFPSVELAFDQLFNRWNRSQSVSETYMLNERGVMLSASRYAELLNSFDLPSVGPNSADVATTSPLGHDISNSGGTKLDSIQSAQMKKSDLSQSTGRMLLVRDPGVNLLEGRKAIYTPTAWPPTLMALQLSTGNSGLSVDGYRNYVGQPVVGAWRWIPQLQVGLAIEEHLDDAFALARTAQRSIWGLTGLFATTVAGVTLFMLLRMASRGLRDISDVGPYQVQELLGQGGMGRVYLAEHALLCRQSAVKVLSGPEIDRNAISRFEREVQLASQLTHPNTISIYDFGRNNEGLFYYAMEYINGAHLGQLVEYSGPIHPGRCIYILSQLCRALSEAHHVGVVHRDIKPQNVMVCNRGGEPDFVKLFDYGLVKAFAPGVTPTASQTKIVVGTPRFMAPERLRSPWLADPRVDIYSIGALAYYLLTAKLPPLFTTSAEAPQDHPGIETLDLPTSAVEFGELLGICLSPEPGNRPSNMRDLLDSLEELSERFPWSRQDSVVWWAKHEAKLLQLVKSRQKKLIANLIGRDKA